MPQVILNEPRVRALVVKREAASVTQHVRMSKQGQRSHGAVFLQGEIYGRAVQRPALLTHKKRLAASASSWRVASAMP